MQVDVDVNYCYKQSKVIKIWLINIYIYSCNLP